MNTNAVSFPDWYLERIRKQQLVIMAGAGVSAGTPSKLPNWFQLNQMIVSALGERVDSYVRRPGYSAEVRASIDSRRDAGTFPPDYQAQILEENCGVDYFRALGALDIPAQNAAHEWIAWLAKHGMVAAIVTTNFDRLIERTLDAHSVPFDSCYDEKGYERALERLVDRLPGPLPVFKVHGCVTCLESLVDTLKQRLLGRDRFLDRSLERLLGAHPWVFVGFSARDLETDDNYLRFIPSASLCPGIMYVQWPGHAQLSAGAGKLLSAFEGKAAHVIEDTAPFLASLAAALNLPKLPPYKPIENFDTKAHVESELKKWVDSLHPADVTNCLATVLEGNGLTESAFQLLHTFWRRVDPDHREGPSFDRYRFHHGRLGVAGGVLSTVDDLGTDKGMESLQNLLRVKHDNPAAAAWAAVAFMWSGQYKLAMPLLNESEGAFLGKARPELRAETWIAFAEATFTLCMYEPVFETWKGNANKAREAGDLPRQARILGLASLFCAEFLPEAYPKLQQDYVADVLKSAARLNDPGIMAFHDLARGRFLTKQQSSPEEALETLQRAASLFRAAGRPPWALYAAIESAKALLDQKTGENWKEGADLLNEINQHVDRYQIWVPWYLEAVGQARVLFGDIEQGRSAFQKGVEAAQAFGLTRKAEALRQYFEMEPLKSAGQKEVSQKGSVP